VSEMAVRTDMAGPVDVGQIRLPEVRSTPVQGPPVSCDDDDPVLPTPEIDIAGERHPHRKEKYRANRKQYSSHLATLMLSISTDRTNARQTKLRQQKRSLFDDHEYEALRFFPTIGSLKYRRRIKQVEFSHVKTRITPGRIFSTGNAKPFPNCVGRCL